MSSFVLNFVDVKPNREAVDLCLLTGNVSSTLLTHIINRYCEGFIATPLLRGYGGLKVSMYVASFSESVNEAVIRKKLHDAVRRYVMEGDSRRGRASNIDVDGVGVELLSNVSSKSYVVTRLLNNAVGKLLPKEPLCHESVGSLLSCYLCLNLSE